MTTMRGSRTAVVPAALALLVLGAGAGYWWGRRAPERTGSTPTSSAGGARVDAGAPAGERNVLYWHDPMVPGARFDKPGKSPFMDMQLVPVYAHDGRGDGSVRIAPNVMQSLGVRTGRVERRALPVRFAAVGSVAFDERLSTIVTARVDGYVHRLHVVAPLTRVRRGEPLVDLVAPAWLEAGREYLALLESASPRTEPLRDAARARLGVLGVPEAEILRIERLRRVDGATTLVAPRDGVVAELGVRAGDAVSAGARLFRLNGLDSVWVNAAIPEAAAAAIQPGATVTARATAWPGASFAGRVLALLPAVDAETRTLTARVVLGNGDGRLAPGMYVTLDFAGPAAAPQLSLPSEAIIRTGERTTVIAAGERGSFNVVEVEAGADRDGRTVILAGLTEGQSVVLSGQFLIDSEASLRSTVDRFRVADDEPSRPAHDPATHDAATHWSESQP